MLAVCCKFSFKQIIFLKEQFVLHLSSRKLALFTLYLWSLPNLIKIYLLSLASTPFNVKCCSQDYELQNWIKDLHDNGYPVSPGHTDHGVPTSFTSSHQLYDFITCIIFTCACQHAAVNFSQMDVYGFPPNSPALIRQPPPTKKGVVTMKDLMKSLATKHQASLTIATVYDLTRIFPDEVCLNNKCKIKRESVL